MTTKNETTALVGALAISMGLLVAGGWWFVHQNEQGHLTLPWLLDTSSQQVAMADRLSYGERLLLQGDRQPAKDQGISAYAEGEYAQAQQFFETALQENSNDPEALIYLNNAKASLKQPVAIAVTVSMPVDTDTSGAKELLRGVAQAQKEFNDAGNALKVLIGDDDGNPEVAAKLAQEFAKKSEILGVIGHFSSDTSLAAAQVYQSKGLAMISPTSTSVNLSTAGDYIFRTVPSDRFTSNALTNYLLNTLNVGKVVIFYNATSDYSNSLKNSLTTDFFALGGNVVAEVDVNQDGFNGARMLADAKEKGAEAIALLTDTPTLIQALQVIQVNENQLPIVAGDSLYKPETLEIGGRDAEGMVLAVPWHVQGNPDATFPKTSRALWGGDVNWRTALSYDAAQAFIAAIQQNPKPNRKAIQTSLTSPSFSVPGSAQSIQFLPSGDINRAMQMVVVEKGGRSGFNYDYVALP